MSSSTEKMNQARHDDVRSTKDLKDTVKHKASMFICEEHVTLWITPKPKRNNQ